MIQKRKHWNLIMDDEIFEEWVDTDGKGNNKTDES
jgi:hypothetical protein